MVERKERQGRNIRKAGMKECKDSVKKWKKPAIMMKKMRRCGMLGMIMRGIYWRKKYG